MSNVTRRRPKKQKTDETLPANPWSPLDGCKPWQRKVVDLLLNSSHFDVVTDAYRGAGKSDVASRVAVHLAMSTPGIQIKHIAKTQKQCRAILRPLYAGILADCPEEFLPKFNTQDGAWYFPHTDATIIVAGTDNNRVDDLRGTPSDLVIHDECGFQDELEYLLEALNPRLDKSTLLGKNLYISTPPYSPAHYYSTIVKRAIADGSYQKFTIADDPEVTEEQRLRREERMGGRDSTACRRELYCEHITEEKYAVVPDVAAGRTVLQSYHEMPNGDRFVNFVCVYFDFTNMTSAVFCTIVPGQSLFVRRVVSYRQTNTRALVDDLAYHEKQIFGEQSYFRVAIGRDSTVEFIAQQTRAFFIAVNFDVTQAGTDAVRRLLSTSRVYFAPETKPLQDDISFAVFDEGRNGLAKDATGGTFNTLIAFMGAAIKATPHLHDDSNGSRYDLKTVEAMSRALMGVAFRKPRNILH
jgi:hypothetical protein